MMSDFSIQWLEDARSPSFPPHSDRKLVPGKNDEKPAQLRKDRKQDASPPVEMHHRSEGVSSLKICLVSGRSSATLRAIVGSSLGF